MENEDYLKTKFDNMFIKILSSVMFNELDQVKHFMNDEIYEVLKNKIDTLNSKDEIQMYDELNVKSTEIVKTYEDDDNYYVDVVLTSRYMDYILNKKTSKVIKGNNSSRIEKVYYLTFSKMKSGKTQGIFNKCPNCGAPLDTNATGICSYCKSIYNQKKYDYILIKMSC